MDTKVLIIINNTKNEILLLMNAQKYSKIKS